MKKKTDQKTQGKWLAIGIYAVVIVGFIYIEQSWFAAASGLLLGLGIGAMWHDSVKGYANSVVTQLDKLMNTKKKDK